MPNWFFADADGIKQGPINDQQLQSLVKQGIIVPTTIMETDSGHKGQARQIPGLNFSLHYRPVPFPRRDASMPTQSNNSIFLWLFDFSFQNRQFQTINLWCCRILYAIGLVLAVLICLFYTFGLLREASYDKGAIVVIPFVWIGAISFIIGLRLVCEWS
ncbi:MAG: DUF4282 domain-containing protein, partial [Thermoguttaceae bacterium]